MMPPYLQTLPVPSTFKITTFTIFIFPSAAIEVNQGSLTMDTATITNNQWRSLHVVNMSTVVVLDSVFASNVANLSTIIVDSSELNFHDTRFFRNYYDIRRQPAVVPAGVFMVMNQGKRKN